MADAAVDTSGRWAWSAWTIWRGDLKLLARAARVALLAVGGDEGSAKVEIAIAARGDEEKFDSVDDFVEQVTPQAMSRFTRLTIRARAKGRSAEVLMARKRDSSFPFLNTRGLVVQAWVEGDDDGAIEKAQAMCEELRVTLRRGSLPWTRGLKQTETSPRTSIAELLGGLGRRRTMTTMLIVTFLASLPFYAFFTLLSLDLIKVNDLDGVVIYLLVAQTLILVVGLPAARIVMPPIELAEITPGRRMARLIGRSGLVTVLAGLALAFVKAKAGWNV
jgi:hypothetical protein